MPDDKAQLLARLLDAFFFAEFCEPAEKAKAERERDSLLLAASEMSGRSAGLIKEAILKSRYPLYRAERLKRELPGTPSELRKQ